jgi:hypothetical protein
MANTQETDNAGHLYKGKWRDRAWKEVLTDGARGALEYFMPDLAADMDTKKKLTGISGLELYSAGTSSEKEMRNLDVLFEVPMKDGTNDNVVLFIEQQHETSADFALRMFETYIRLHEKRRLKTTGFAIYTGNMPDINTYFESCYGFKVSVEFRTFHLPSKSIDELKKDPRPFALVLLAGRYSHEAGESIELREKYAWEILSEMNERGYNNSKEVIFLLDFLGKIFRLKDPQISLKLKEMYNMQTLPIEEYAKQIKLENAREEGREEGEAKGKLEGKLEMARAFIKEGLSVEKVAQISGIASEELKKYL